MNASLPAIVPAAVPASGAPAIDSTARYVPAGQPSVRDRSAGTAPRGTSTPAPAATPSPSAVVRLTPPGPNSGDPTPSGSRVRSRAGRVRPAITTLHPGG